MKRGILQVFALIILISSSYALNLGTTKGYILDTDDAIQIGANIAITVNGCSGVGCSATAISDANGFYIKSNLNIVPGNNVSVTATKGSATGTNSRLAVGSGSVGVATINVTICTPPTTPTLTAVADTHNNALITMSWASGIGGTKDEFQFDSDAINSTANSDQKRYNVAYAAHTWRVRTCNTFCCSAYVTDTFVVTNSAPTTPTLADQGHTTDTTPTLTWTNGIDSDGDTTHNEWQISTDSGFSTIIESDLTATSPKTTATLTTLSMYYWRVRTCDLIACSSYAEDSFFVYECPACTTVTTAEGGGTRTKYRNVTEMCYPSWECKDWGSCSSGVSTRSCLDINECVNSLPKEYQVCTGGVLPIVEQPKPIVTEEPTSTAFGSKPFFEKNIVFVFCFFFIIIIILCLMLIHQDRKYVAREKKIDRKLITYVSTALGKGFTENQIRTKLADTGIDEIEIDYVFNKTKESRTKGKAV